MNATLTLTEQAPTAITGKPCKASSDTSSMPARVKPKFVSDGGCRGYPMHCWNGLGYRRLILPCSTPRAGSRWISGVEKTKQEDQP